MAKPKSATRIFTRLFDRTANPVYLVSPDAVVAYANEACAAWVGLDLNDLISGSCVFSSQDLNQTQRIAGPIDHQNHNVGSQNKIQGLSPSPSLLNAVAGSQHVFDQPVFAVDGNHQKSWRQAIMHPFFDADQNHLGVLVICGDTEFAQPPATSESAGLDHDQTLRLHTALATIRTETDRTYAFEGLVGRSPFANRLRRQIRTAIESNSDLLIFGPAGSGKEHLSRTIHAGRDQTGRSELLPVHCSIADQKLIQQNIKDIVASRAMTNTDTNKTAQDWLLLLDVDQLGEAAQVELLGFFELPDFPLRTIATSSASLIELAEREEYSTELAHHLSTMTIELVPLAKRQEDVPVLAQALIERDNFRRGRQLSGFSESVIQQFIEFHWPENIDQLNRIVQVAAQNTKTSLINESDLPDEFRSALSAMRIGTAKETRIELEAYLGGIEKELIVRALTQAKGNKTKAAKLLGINRPKLLRRLQFFEIETPDSEPATRSTAKIPDSDASGSDASDSDELDSSAFEELD